MRRASVALFAALVVASAASPAFAGPREEPFRAFLTMISLFEEFSYRSDEIDLSLEGAGIKREGLVGALLDSVSVIEQKDLRVSLHGRRERRVPFGRGQLVISPEASFKLEMAFDYVVLWDFRGISYVEEGKPVRLRKIRLYATPDGGTRLVAKVGGWWIFSRTEEYRLAPPAPAGARRGMTSALGGVGR